MAKASATVRQVWANSAKGPYKWHITMMLEDAEGNLFMWTTTQSGGSSHPVPMNKTFDIVGDVLETIHLHGGRTMTRITKCKVLEGVVS